MQCHPDQANQYFEAWKRKQEREKARTAALQHIIAVSGGVKINGRAAKFEDFMRTEKKKKNPKLAEAQLKVALLAFAKPEKKEST